MQPRSVCFMNESFIAISELIQQVHRKEPVHKLNIAISISSVQIWINQEQHFNEM